MILCGYQLVASLHPNAYSYEDAETDSVSKPILISESIPMSEPILISEPISIPELTPIPEPNPEQIPVPVPEPISEPIPELIPVADSGPTIRNRFQKTSEQVGIDSDEIFIFIITTPNAIWLLHIHKIIVNVYAKKVKLPGLT